MGLTKPRAAQIFNLDYKQSTRAVTVSNVTLISGAPSSVDGVGLVKGDRILVIGQTTGSQNGLYQVSVLGTGSNGTWVRTSDGNENGEIEAGMIVMVTEGAIYADTQWKLITDDPITVGTTALTFIQNYSANSISGGTSNVTVYSNANVTISAAGTANVVSVGNAAVTFTGNLFPSANVTYTLGSTALRWKDLWLSNSSLYIGDVVLATTGSSLTINGANVLTGNAGAAFSTAGNITGGNILTGGLISATGNITGNYILGNGSQLTGIDATSIQNGNSNVRTFANSNVTISSAGVANVLNVTSTGTTTTGTASVSGNITGGNIAATNLTGTNVSVTSTVTSASTVGGVITGSSTSVTGTTTAASVVGGVITGSSVSVTGTINGTTLTGTSLTVTTGNITGGNLILSGAIEDSAQLDVRTTASNANIVFTPNGTGNVNTGANVSVAGQVTAVSVVGGVITGSSTSVTGTQTAASTVGGVITGTSTSVTGAVSGASASVSGGVTAASVAGGVITGTSTSVTGTVTAASTVGGVITGTSTSVTGAVSGASASVSGGVTAASVVGGVITGSSISVTGAQTAASTVGGVITGSSASLSGNVTGGNIVTTGLVTVSGNVITGNILTNGYYYANGVVFGGGGGGSPGGANTQLQFNDNGVFAGSAGLTFNKTTNAIATTGAISTTGIVTAASTVGGVITGLSVSVSGTVTGASLAGTITTASQTNITSVGTLGSLSVTATTTSGNLLTGGLISATGNVSGGNLNVTGNIVDTGPLGVVTGSNGNIILDPNGTGVIVVTKDIRNGQANGVGNIGASGAAFNTIFARATSAQYADLAEMYVADADYAPGTVVEFGGTAEITRSSTDHSTQVAGIISTNPSYLMNDSQVGDHVLAVALIGRVPCQVIGTINKGDRLVASDRPGVATVLDITKYQPACIVGKALENYNSVEIGIIEVAVGRT
jgi:hypothetical protein